MNKFWTKIHIFDVLDDSKLLIAIGYWFQINTADQEIQDRLSWYGWMFYTFLNVSVMINLGTAYLRKGKWINKEILFLFWKWNS